MAQRPADAQPLSLSHEQIAELRAELALFPRRVGERGQRYAAERRVEVLATTPECIEAVVFGTEPYDVSWSWMEDGWLPACTCPVAPECKHAYALACCVLAAQQPQVGAGRSRGPMSPAVRSSSRTQRSQDGLWYGATARTRSRRSQRGPSPLERLRGSRDAPWLRHQALAALLAEGSAPDLAWDAAVGDILMDEDPDLRCWRIALVVARRTEGWLPEPLAPFRDRPDLAERHTERARHTLARDLLDWAGGPRARTPRRLRLVFGLAEGAGTAVVRVEARLTTPRLDDDPRSGTQLQQLRNEVRRSAGALPPAEVLLLDLLLDSGYATAMSYGDVRGGVGQAGLLALLGRLTGPLGALATWGDDVSPALAERAGVRPGAPVRLSGEPARLLPSCKAHDGATWVTLAFHWSDDRRRPLDEAVHLRGSSVWGGTDPSLVLADGVFSVVTEQPPRALLERFAETGGLPLRSEERGTILGQLLARFPHLESAVAPHRRLLAVSLAVVLDLRDEEWLQLRAFAHPVDVDWRPMDAVPTGQGDVCELASDGRWVPLAAGVVPVGGVATASIEVDPPPESALLAEPSGPGDPTVGAAPAVPARPTAPANDVWIEELDPAIVAPLVEWMASTGARPGTRGHPGGQQPVWDDRDVGWWMSAGRKRMGAFADAWDARPPGVAFFGTARVRRLLSGADRVAPRVTVTASGLDWFAVSADWEAEGVALSDADIARLRTSTERFVRLKSGWVRRDIVDAHGEVMEVLADLGIEPGAGEQRLGLWQLAGAKETSRAALARLGVDPATVRAVERLRKKVARFTGLPHIAPPRGLTATLRSYQQQGLDFLVHASGLGIGVVLADDMGLGKTVQALAWLEHLRAADPAGGPSLVVCPASVVHVWAGEAARFVPDLRVLCLTSGRERHALRETIPAHDLIVTTYALLRHDRELWAALELRAAILDEAQQIKNPDAAVTRAALALRARYRLALTGTPLENRALDLWSIVGFANPGYLGSRRAFVARYDRHDAPPHTRALLAAKLRPILLRRLKRDVARDLPARIEEVRRCELTRGQRQLYLAELRRSRRIVDKLAAETAGIRKNKIMILAALTRLRQICCHPALVGGAVRLGSGKFETLVELLEPLLAEGHKVLIFSQFVGCLKRLETMLTRQGVACHVLTGATTKRAQVVAAFSDDPRPAVFLISLRAGGTGLNLTSASYVVLFDPWWNPAVEAQAIDRTHRIGQHRTVIAYRMIAAGTIEEKIWALQERKAALARDVLGEDGFARSLTRDDLQYLLE